MNGVLLILAIVAIVALIVAGVQRGGGKLKQTQLEDARADAQRWYERLGGQVLNLHAEDPAARQALADASERYNAAGGQLQQATTVRQFELARESALEGLAYVRAGRVAMGLDPGPDVPPLAASRGSGQLTQEREVSVQGHAYRAGPQPGPDTPYYYPGGRVQGRPVPSGWYSTPVWKTALGTGAGVLGGMLIFDALFSPSFGDVGAFADGSYADGYQDGIADGGDVGGDGGGDVNSLGDVGGGGGDWGGGDFGGGDFGGGDFGGGDF
ncbi:DUF2076 domain-containing protein [Actinoplanes awajinensis]|uniref:DUF1542 domain-containing protein n=1 Tax=Actinoplanes awajinensis subsp. mycoplanecinus TaxID=135947 RepID=A0A117MK73_9ACTN|nr:hypothetical protein [Actinoplanes awajinensis]KUL21927.1 hypothetical protein ADL15_49530 [Actinoplanes awajinensis subsp. mycoplanecinus]